MNNGTPEGRIEEARAELIAADLDYCYIKSRCRREIENAHLTDDEYYEKFGFLRGGKSLEGATGRNK